MLLVSLCARVWWECVTSVSGYLTGNSWSVPPGASQTLHWTSWSHVFPINKHNKHHIGPNSLAIVPILHCCGVIWCEAICGDGFWVNLSLFQVLKAALQLRDVIVETCKSVLLLVFTLDSLYPHYWWLLIRNLIFWVPTVGIYHT